MQRPPCGGIVPSARGSGLGGSGPPQCCPRAVSRLVSRSPPGTAQPPRRRRCWCGRGRRSTPLRPRPGVPARERSRVPARAPAIHALAQERLNPPRTLGAPEVLDQMRVQGAHEHHRPESRGAQRGARRRHPRRRHRRPLPVDEGKHVGCTAPHVTARVPPGDVPAALSRRRDQERHGATGKRRLDLRIPDDQERPCQHESEPALDASECRFSGQPGCPAVEPA